ncbi:MAG: type II secretion system protein [Gemmatimonadota bacterium]
MSMRTTRSGFTIVELLVVIIIVSILAALAIPRFVRARERAYYAAMIHDLDILQNMEEIYYHDSGAFLYKTAGTITDAGNDMDLNMHASRGVTITLGAHPHGWAATATHLALAGGQCNLFWGDDGTVGVANTAGRIECNND